MDTAHKTDTIPLSLEKILTKAKGSRRRWGDHGKELSSYQPVSHEY